MIRRVYGDAVEVIPIPVVAAIVTGRKVGYGHESLEPPSDVGEISGTSVRAGREMRVPNGVAEYLKVVHGTIWFTGLPCSGKTTLADALARKMGETDKDYRVKRLDGDEVRTGLCEGLGFSDEGRWENLRRIAYVCKMFNDVGVTVLASFVSPLKKQREMIAKIIPNLHVVHVECTVDECARRDVKGMWAQAKAGKIKGFTGYDATYESPDEPVCRVLTSLWSIDECIQTVIDNVKI